jgi:anthranilate phosphoribosyltransferase
MTTSATGELTWRTLLGSLLAGESLSTASSSWAMGEILAGAATDAQIAGFAVALRAKGETVEEVTGLATAMLSAGNRITVDLPAVDVVGTGGDLAYTYNVSTMAAIVTAGAGVPVVKHGNRSASSSAGTADVLELLGIRLDLEPQQVVDVACRAGITFCFAPAFHPALRFAAGPRRELGVPTVFNNLGPLTNPAQPPHYAIGVASRHMLEVIAGVVAGRGQDGLVFRGDDGLDELTTTTTSTVCVIDAGRVHTEVLDPAELGIGPVPSATLRGGDAQANAAMVHRVLAGESGPVRDVVLLNAAAAIAAATPSAAALVPRLREGLDRATEAIDSGAAVDLLASWVAAMPTPRLSAT